MPIAFNAITIALKPSINAIKFALLPGVRLRRRRGPSRRTLGLRQQPIDQTIGDGPAEGPAKQRAHVVAGRAHDNDFFAEANGSNQLLGLDNVFIVSTLKQTGPNFYVIGSCH